MDALTLALLDASRAVGADSEPQEVLEALLDCVHRLVPTTSATVLRVEDGVARVCAHRGWAAFGDPTGLSFSLADTPHLKRLVDGPQSVLIPDTSVAVGWEDREGSSHTRSWLGVPLVADGRVLGVYSLDQEHVGGFEPSDIGRVEALAAHGAVAVKTSLLIAELTRARTAADEANAAKSAFLASASHELRTPLNAVVGYAELVHETASDLGHDELTEDTEHIRQAAHHLLTLVDAILDLSQVEAGRMEVSLDHIDLAELAREAVAAVRPIADARGNTVGVSGVSALWVHTDPRRVRQILLNLLGNAVKFTRSGRIEVVLSDGGAHARIEVADDGIGLEDAKLERIFEPFQQADASIGARFGGSGLGLSLSRELARLLGGEIAVRSAVGVGTRFTVTLPR